MAVFFFSWVWIVSDQRYQGTFSSELHMNAFPFDIQHLEVLLQTGWGLNRARIVYPNLNPATIASTTSRMAINIGWTFLRTDIVAGSEYTYAYNNQTFSRLSFQTTWERQPQYYLTKIVAGVMLAVWMCIVSRSSCIASTHLISGCCAHVVFFSLSVPLAASIVFALCSGISLSKSTYQIV